MNNSTKHFQANNNRELIQDLKNQRIVRSSLVFDVMCSIDRKNFTTNVSQAYVDAPHVIAEGQTITAPHMHAATLELFIDKFPRGRRALDIGSGSGYLTTCLALALGENGVAVGIECKPKLQKMAERIINNNYSELLANQRIKFIAGDGRSGYLEMGPYEIIHVGAAVSEVPQILIQQLAPGGRLIVPIGTSANNQVLTQIDKLRNGKITKKSLMAVSYGFMIDVNYQYEKQREISLCTEYVSKYNITDINNTSYWLHETERMVDSRTSQSLRTQHLNEKIERRNAKVKTNQIGMKNSDTVHYKHQVESARNKESKYISMNSCQSSGEESNLTSIMSEYKTLKETLLKSSILRQTENLENNESHSTLLGASVLSQTSYMKIVNKTAKMNDTFLEEKIIGEKEIIYTKTEKLMFLKDSKIQYQQEKAMIDEKLKNSTRKQVNARLELEKDVQVWENNATKKRNTPNLHDQSIKLQYSTSEKSKSTLIQLELENIKETLEKIENKLVPKNGVVVNKKVQSNKRQTEEYKKLEERITALERRLKMIQQSNNHVIKEHTYSKLKKSVEFHSTAIFS